MIKQYCYELKTRVKLEEHSWIGLITRELDGEFCTELSTLYTLDWWSVLYYN